MGRGFRISALDPSLFERLRGLRDEALAAQWGPGARRVSVDEHPGFPCRVSLADAAVGERVLLLPFIHHDVHTAYRAGGPIYVREGARRAEPGLNEVPESVRRRLLSLRAYDREGMLVSAAVTDGRDFEAAVGCLFAVPGSAYIHVHNAKPGCYNCRVDRAG